MASLLETFFIMFESNADKVKRGNDDAKRSTGDLEQSLGNTDRAATAMGEHFLSTLRDVAVGMAAAFSIGHVLDRTGEEAKLNAQLGITAERLGWAVENLDAWNRATLLAGGTEGDFASSLDFLNKNLATVDVTGRSRLLPFLEEMKIKALDAHGKMRPLPALLKDLADKFHVMDVQKAAGFAERLGVSPGLLLLLRKGGDEVGRLVEEIKAHGVASKEDTDAAMAWRAANLELDDTFGDIYRRLGTEVLPIMVRALEKARDWINYLDSHRNLVVGFFGAVGAAVTLYYLPAMTEAAIATWAALAPILAVVLPILALAAAFALLYDDVMNFLAGNRSVIGELSKRWPIVGEVVHAVVDGIGAAFEWLKGIAVPLFSAIGNAARVAWDVGLLIAVPIINLVAGAVRLLAPVFRAAFSAIANDPIIHSVVWLFEHLAEVIGAVGKALGWLAGELDKSLPHLDLTGGLDYSRLHANALAGRAALASANAVPFNSYTPYSFAGAGGGPASKSVRIDVGGVTVNTQATDPDAVGQVVHTTLGDQLRQATDHFDDGVRG